MTVATGAELAANGVTDVNELPVLGGTVAGQAVNDNALVRPFVAVTLADAEDGPLAVEVRLSSLVRGGFVPATLAGWTDLGGGR